MRLIKLGCFNCRNIRTSRIAIFLIIGSESFSEYLLMATTWPFCLLIHLKTTPFAEKIVLTISWLNNLNIYLCKQELLLTYDPMPILRKRSYFDPLLASIIIIELYEGLMKHHSLVFLTRKSIETNENNINNNNKFYETLRRWWR